MRVGQSSFIHINHYWYWFIITIYYYFITLVCLLWTSISICLYLSFTSSWFNNHHPVSYWSHYHSTSISIHSLTRAYIHITLSTFKSEYSSLCVYVIQSAVIYILCVSLSSYYLLDTQPVESLSLCVCFLYLLLNWKYNPVSRCFSCIPYYGFLLCVLAPLLYYIVITWQKE